MPHPHGLVFLTWAIGPTSELPLSVWTFASMHSTLCEDFLFIYHLAFFFLNVIILNCTRNPPLCLRDVANSSPPATSGGYWLPVLMVIKSRMILQIPFASCLATWQKTLLVNYIRVEGRMLVCCPHPWSLACWAVVYYVDMFVLKDVYLVWIWPLVCKGSIVKKTFQREIWECYS